MANNSPPRYLSVQGISTTNGGQTYAGNFFDCVWGSKSPDADKEAATNCRNALFLTDPYVDRERLISAKGTRVPGTCEWIVYHESYRAWLSDNGITRPLWISGGPGKGKTMMSVFLTEELERHVKPMHNTDLVFFFCTAGNEECNTAVTVLRGLVHQIITKRPQLVKHALEHFKTPKRTKQTLSSLETLWVIFSKLVADDELGTMFCVLDGLDECQENGVRHLISRLVRLFKNNLLSTKSKFKLAIISRNLPGLKDCIQIKLDPDNDEKVGSDINLFVSARLDELSEIGGFDSIRADIQETLLNRAQGTFLWVGFAMYELLQKQTCSEIYETLQDLPSGLPAIYSRMLLQIPAGKRKISQTILQWVTLAVRPLQLKELAAVLRTQLISSQIDDEQATRDAITSCGPLMKLQGKTVSLVHQSARDYLLRKEHDSDPTLEKFRLQAESSHFKLAQACIDCLVQCDFLYEYGYPYDALDSLGLPLLQYAMLYWSEHVDNCDIFGVDLSDPSGQLLYPSSCLLDFHLFEHRGNKDLGIGLAWSLQYKRRCRALSYLFRLNGTKILATAYHNKLLSHFPVESVCRLHTHGAGRATDKSETEPCSFVGFVEDHWELVRRTSTWYCVVVGATLLFDMYYKVFSNKLKTASLAYAIARQIELHVYLLYRNQRVLKPVGTLQLKRTPELLNNRGPHATLLPYLYFFIAFCIN